MIILKPANWSVLRILSHTLLIPHTGSHLPLNNLSNLISKTLYSKHYCLVSYYCATVNFYCRCSSVQSTGTRASNWSLPASFSLTFRLAFPTTESCEISCLFCVVWFCYILEIVDYRLAFQSIQEWPMNRIPWCSFSVIELQPRKSYASLPYWNNGRENGEFSSLY